MKYDAVSFDLFGTLVNRFSIQEHEQVVANMAASVGVPYADFAPWWVDKTWAQRVVGELATIEANVAYICRALGVQSVDACIAAATRALLDFTRKALAPRLGALEVLTALKATGSKIGLISDCSAAVPALWPETPFAPLVDVPIFSAAAGLRKPDPRIYRLACERLDAMPGQCLYVGDGSSDELSGALQAGLPAVLLRCDYSGSYDVHRPAVDGWHGPEIATLAEVLRLVD